mgnify:CR=1 FL=1
MTLNWKVESPNRAALCCAEGLGLGWGGARVLGDEIGAAVLRGREAGLDATLVDALAGAVSEVGALVMDLGARGLNVHPL